MVWKLDCDCDERMEMNITSFKELEKVKEFFRQQVKQGIFVEESPL